MQMQITKPSKALDNQRTPGRCRDPFCQCFFGLCFSKKRGMR